MYKLTIKFRNGIEGTYKTPFNRKNIEDTKVSDCSYAMYLRYAKSIQRAAMLFDSDSYLRHEESVITYFDAAITSFEKIDGRTKEAQSLEYFTVEEVLRNFYK